MPKDQENKKSQIFVSLYGVAGVHNIKQDENIWIATADDDDDDAQLKREKMDGVCEEKYTQGLGG
jgi:hypothetical protein